jgi:hypothetical protein
VANFSTLSSDSLFSFFLKASGLLLIDIKLIEFIVRILENYFLDTIFLANLA